MKKAFTLIELIAVIIILAVIALITTPIVLDVVESAKMSAFESTAYGVMDAIKLKNMENIINNEKLEDKYILPNDDIFVQGQQPDGIVSIDPQGRLSMAVHNGKWCATKGYLDGTIKLTEYVAGECVEPVIGEKIKKLILDENGNCKTDGTAYEYMGGCYIKHKRTKYFENHIWYNGFLWRIMGINSDGTVRMITEENVTIIPYNDVNNINFEGSYVDDWLNDYFYNKLSNENNLKDIIVEGTFCQGAATTTSPSEETCTGKTITRNVGLITVDEYNLSIADEGTSYLKNTQYFWTMSPSDTNKVWSVQTYGQSSSDTVRSIRGIRPVINVDYNAYVSSGDGTLKDFYILGEFKEDTNIAGTLSNVKVGEYVNLNNKIYRVVENGNTTKLILDGYYQEPEGTNYIMKFGDNNIFTTEKRNIEDDTLIGIGYKLNNDVLDWLTAGDNQEKLKSMIITSNWYQNKFVHGHSYINSIAQNNNPIEAKVGLIRIGEMLSGLSYSILTKNGTEASNYENAESYWTITPYETDTEIWLIYRGARNENTINNMHALRPVINVSSDLKITSGNGTSEHEYVVNID